VSVACIIPLYNKAAHIIAAVESVLAQTTPVDEIILIDDGSTDGGDLLAEQTFGALIRLVRQPNAGPGAARNHGMQLATSVYCAFLDADDIWLPHHVEELLRITQSFGELGLYADGLGELGQPIDTTRSAIGLVPDYAGSWVAGKLIVSTCAAMVHRAAALHMGGFATSSNRGEDLTLWLKLTDGMAMGTSDRIGALYRRDASDLTRQPAREPDAAMQWISERLRAPDLTAHARTQLVHYRARLALLHCAQWVRFGDRAMAKRFLIEAGNADHDSAKLRQLRLLAGPLWPLRKLIIAAARLASKARS
jgi:glycosyltransferase involved in cell wall biosynthesis